MNPARFLGPAFGVVMLAAPSIARAEGSDGAYGRLDGDVELRLHAGAAFAAGGPALAASLSALYMSTAGIYVHYTDAVGSEAPRVARSIAAGVHFAPLFLARFSSNAERGPAFLDLFLDSFAFELGAVWSAPRAMPAPMMPPPYGMPMTHGPEPASFDETPGLEAALGVAVPLIGRATGPFLGFRAALRWRPSDFAPAAPTNVVDRGALMSLTLGWHHVLRTHLVDPGDQVKR